MLPVSANRSVIRYSHVAQGFHWLMAALMVGLHAAAALWHQLVRRDGVLLRMLPGGADAEP